MDVDLEGMRNDLIRKGLQRRQQWGGEIMSRAFLGTLLGGVLVGGKINNGMEGANPFGVALVIAFATAVVTSRLSYAAGAYNAPRMCGEDWAKEVEELKREKQR